MLIVYRTKIVMLLFFTGSDCFQELLVFLMLLSSCLVPRTHPMNGCFYALCIFLFLLYTTQVTIIKTLLTIIRMYDKRDKNIKRSGINVKIHKWQEIFTFQKYCLN